MTLYRDGLHAIGIDAMICSLTQYCKAVVLQIFDQVTPFDAHGSPLLQAFR